VVTEGAPPIAIHFTASFAVPTLLSASWTEACICGGAASRITILVKTMILPRTTTQQGVSKSWNTTSDCSKLFVGFEYVKVVMENILHYETELEDIIGG
jgi:hypothetical protein